MEPRRGDWIQTYSLKQFFPLDPRPEDIDIQDIAHALSMQCRFTGHCHTYYSVAEHCVRVSQRAQELLSGLRSALYVAQWGLLHDAAEAYLVDLARPVKHTPELSGYRAAERQILSAVLVRFGLDEDEPVAVKQADTELLYTEARDLFPGVHPDWHWYTEPLPERIVPMTQPEAKAAFLARFSVLFGSEQVTR